MPYIYDPEGDFTEDRGDSVTRLMIGGIAISGDMTARHCQSLQNIRSVIPRVSRTSSRVERYPPDILLERRGRRLYAENLTKNPPAGEAGGGEVAGADVIGESVAHAPRGQ